MNLPRSAAAGLLVVAFAFLATACGGVKNPEGWASPVSQDSNVYYFPEKDRVTALSLEGEAATQQWSFPVDGRDDDFHFKAVYDASLVDGRLYFGSWDGRVLAIDGESGEMVWTLKDEIDGGIVGGPIVVDGLVVFGTNEGELYVRSAETGEAVDGWPADGLGFPEGIWAAPVVTAGKVFIATMAGEVTAFDLETGDLAWDQPFSITGAIADLVATDEYLIVPSFNKHLYVVDPESGETIGDYRASNWIWTRPVVLDDALYFGDLDGKIYGLDITETGLVERWAPIDAGASVKAAPVVIDGVLIVATRDPEVLFIDSESGAVQNTVPIDSGTVRASLLQFEDRALVATTEGDLFLANPENTSVVPVEGEP